MARKQRKLREARVGDAVGVCVHCASTAPLGVDFRGSKRPDLPPRVCQACALTYPSGWTREQIEEAQHLLAWRSEYNESLLSGRAARYRVKKAAGDAVCQSEQGQAS